jgi:hypothetical protein
MARRAASQTAKAVAALATMPLAGLRAEWQRRYGDPPRHRSANLLRRVLAWRIQADVHSGLDAPTRRMLEKDQSEVKVSPTAGMRLAREWAGRRHEVCVIGSGVVYEGCTYGSLSEVARHITGQRWNGPRFFGLRQENVR